MLIALRFKPPRLFSQITKETTFDVCYYGLFFDLEDAKSSIYSTLFVDEILMEAAPKSYTDAVQNSGSEDLYLETTEIEDGFYGIKKAGSRNEDNSVFLIINPSKCVMGIQMQLFRFTIGI